MSREKMLNRPMLVSAIKKICSENYKKYNVSEIIHIDGHRHRVEIEADGASFFVDFHYRPNGSTSIDISSGHHIDKKKLIKDAILKDTTLILTNNS
ncbi:hypothetical protein [Dendrosporobacter sp. 1207_IL3150]|uniref:hypothetical protein n=1 Tax=Dendrosporobacter sp. 1207_IL3150 TaxID=3084054 RepID=UPI002FDA7109